MLKIRITALALVAMLVFPAMAFGQSGQEGYAGPNNVVAGIGDEGNDGGDDGGDEGGVAGVDEASGTEPAVVTADTEASGSLPFTGADLGVLAVAGALMLAFGFGLRRLTHRPSQT